MFKKNKNYICTLIGVVSIILGCCLGLLWNDIISRLVGQQMTLSPTSPTYEGWQSFPVAVYLDIYFFNWTNPKEITNHNTKPILTEVGPYSFLEKSQKVNIIWHPENSSVSFERQNLYFFSEERSNGSLNDMISTINLFAMGAAGKSQDWDSVKTSAVDMLLEYYNQPLAVLKTADELLFRGYTEQLAEHARLTSVLLTIGDEIQIPQKFGFFYTRNGSEKFQGSFNVYTGANDRHRIGQMYSWNYNTKSIVCGDVKGSSTGEFFPQNLKTTDSIKLFSPDMCASLVLDYSETVVIHGVVGYKYVAGKKSVDNGSAYDDIPRCFCSKECYPSGILSFSKCKHDAPVFVSYPHYLYADPFYSEQVEITSLKSYNENDRQMYVVIEPKTGGLMEIVARFQLNVLVQEYKDISLFEGVKKTFVPLVWFEQKASITPEMSENYKIVPKLIIIGTITSGLIIIVGIAIISVIFGSIIVRRRNEKIENEKNRNTLSPLLDISNKK